MADPPFGTKPIVMLGGNRLASEVDPNVVSVVVEDDLAAPSGCLVTLADPDRTVLDTIGVDFLQPLEILASAVEETEPKTIFAGEVYGFDFMADDTGTFALIRAYDPAYRLKQRRGTASFNDVTDADIVRQLARDAGVDTGNLDAAAVIHPYVAQVNQSHWDFLRERAAASDRVLHVREGRLELAPSPKASDGPSPGNHASTDPLQLTAGHNLIYLRVRTTASQQVAGVEVRGWDPGRKEAVVATATAATRSASLETSPADVGTQHGAGTAVTPAPGVTTQAACDVLAASVAERAGAAFTHVEGQALGDPRLLAGVAVSIGSAGRFDGQYTLSAVRHSFDERGYYTYIGVSGDHDRSLGALVGGNGRANGHGLPAPPRFDGVYPAVVTNLGDPSSLGRVKLSFPWLAEDYESDWARVMQIGAGDDRGMLWFPEVGDEVLVTFLAGDARRPVILGGLYNGNDKPPFEGFSDPGDGQVDTRCLKTRAGHTLLFQDGNGKESITLETADGTVKLELDQSGRELRITSKGDITVQADGEVKVTAARDLTLEAAGTATLKGQQGLKLESSGQVSVSGMHIKLN